MVSGGMSCIKYLLFAFNLIFVIFGILLIYAGFSTFFKIEYYELILKEAPSNVAITLIVIGFAIFAIAFLGCCGAIKESYCMLVTFGGVISIILIIELIGAGLVLAFKSKIRDEAHHGLIAAIDQYNITETPDHRPLSQLLDDIQSNLHCCGANDFNDWKRNETTVTQLPESCCPKNGTTKTDKCGPHSENVYKKGCVDALENEIKNSFGLLGGIGIAIALIQLFGIFFACSLGRSIKKEYEVV